MAWVIDIFALIGAVSVAFVGYALIAITVIGGKFEMKLRVGKEDVQDVGYESGSEAR